VYRKKVFVTLIDQREFVLCYETSQQLSLAKTYGFALKQISRDPLQTSDRGQMDKEVWAKPVCHHL
tara:strand:- start:1969 stop:2166 length:198 start_codon:yes stop_codon:yes gene_type:complete